MYAIIETGGKQYRVQTGDVVDVELLDGEASEQVEFNKVLAVGEGAELQVGAPLVLDASVTAEIVDNHKARKVLVFKMKRRKGYMRRKGHRQNYSRVRILDIKTGQA